MTIMEVLKTLLPLFLVIGLLYGALLFVRKYGINFNNAKGGNSLIKVISTKAIMPKKFVSIVKVDDKYFVLGISDNSVNLIKELDDFSSDDKEVDAAKQSTFLDMLKKNMAGK